MSQRNRVVFAAEDPRTPDVADVLALHLQFARDTTPICHVHALDLEGLSEPNITLFAGRVDGEVVAVGAIRHIDDAHCELKSMHVRQAMRGGGVGATLLDHLLSVAADRGYERVSLETGTMDAFAPARRLYERAGFRVCPPFAEYTDNEHSVCMTRAAR